MNKHSIRAAALALALSGACQSSFDKARDLDTAEAYRDFLRENPQDPSTEAARARHNSLVVVSIPESNIEIGGGAGKTALEQRHGRHHSASGKTSSA